MGYRDIKHIIITMLATLLLAGSVQFAFAEGEWNVKSIEFIPVSSTVAMSRILEQDNDGIKALNLANRGSNSFFTQCFFASGDKCIVTYDDGSTKEFAFNMIKGVGFAEFKASDGTVIDLEAIASDLAIELKNSSEVSVDDLAAIIGENGVTIEYGEYWMDEGDPDYEGDDKVVGNYVRTHTTLNVVEDIPHNHSEGVRDRSANPAQCEATGMSRDCVYCQVCGKYFVSKDDFTELDKKDLLIPMLGHAWGDWTVTKPASQTAEGEEKRSCERCGSAETRAIPVVKPEVEPDTKPDESPDETPDLKPSDKPEKKDTVAEGTTETAVKGKSVNTGDDTSLLTWIIISIATLAGLYGIARNRVLRVNEKK